MQEIHPLEKITSEVTVSLPCRTLCSCASNLAILIKFSSLSVIMNTLLFRRSLWASLTKNLAGALISELSKALMHVHFMFIWESRNLAASISPATSTHIIVHLTLNLLLDFWLPFFLGGGELWVSVRLNGIQETKAIGKLYFYIQIHVSNQNEWSDAKFEAQDPPGLRQWSLKSPCQCLVGHFTSRAGSEKPGPHRNKVM